MMYANLGNIDTYITARHSMPEDGQTFDMSGQADSEAEPLSKDEMKKLFRRRRGYVPTWSAAVRFSL